MLHLVVLRGANPRVYVRGVISGRGSWGLRGYVGGLEACDAMPIRRMKSAG